MKKFASLLLFAATAAVVGCGPSEAEMKAAKERQAKRTKDSLDSVKKTVDELINSVDGFINSPTDSANKDSAAKTPEKK